MKLKRVLAFILMFCMVLSLAACGRTQDYDEEEEENEEEAAVDEGKDKLYDHISGENISIGRNETGKSSDGSNEEPRTPVGHGGSGEDPGEKKEEGEGKGSGDGKKDDDQKPGDNGNKGEDGSGDNGGNIPVEEGTPPPVEIDPNLDENEYVWTFNIDGTKEVPFPWPDLPDVKFKVSLKLTGVKDGGKNVFGEYRCTGTWEVKYPDELLAQIFGPNIVNLENVFTHELDDFVMVVEKWDTDKVIEELSLPEESLDFLLPGIGMAFGNFKLTASHQGLLETNNPGEGYQQRSFSAGVHSGEMNYWTAIYDDGTIAISVKPKAIVTDVAFSGKITKKRKPPNS